MHFSARISSDCLASAVSEFDSENELDDCVLLDVVMDDDSDEDDIIQDFV
jgi:hypothetical protein